MKKIMLLTLICSVLATLALPAYGSETRKTFLDKCKKFFQEASPKRYLNQRKKTQKHLEIQKKLEDLCSEQINLNKNLAETAANAPFYKRIFLKPSPKPYFLESSPKPYLEEVKRLKIEAAKYKFYEAPKELREEVEKIWNETHLISPDSKIGKFLGAINPNHNYPKLILVENMKPGSNAVANPGLIRVSKKDWGTSEPLTSEQKRTLRHECHKTHQRSSYPTFVYQYFLKIFGREKEEWFFSEYSAEFFGHKNFFKNFSTEQLERFLQSCKEDAPPEKGFPYWHGTIDACKAVLQERGDKNFPRTTWKARYDQCFGENLPKNEEDFDVPIW